jgi:hypothetical protein
LLVIELASLPLLQWGRPHQCAGIFAVVLIAIDALMKMVLSLLSMCGCPCCCQAGVVALKKVKTLLNELPNFYMSMGRQYFVFLFCQWTEQPHQGNMNNSTSMPRR